mmetsp:Transcript_2005/g.4434  ORF Transcript_2005/g.4434 Transcript_2005/m.4434 type:complete len:126 (+) Transcript_2005:13-390(+)
MRWTFTDMQRMRSRTPPSRSLQSPKTHSALTHKTHSVHINGIHLATTVSLIHEKAAYTHTHTHTQTQSAALDSSSSRDNGASRASHAHRLYTCPYQKENKHLSHSCGSQKNATATERFNNTVPRK